MRVYVYFAVFSLPSRLSLARSFSGSYNMKESNNGVLVYLKSSSNYNRSACVSSSFCVLVVSGRFSFVLTVLVLISLHPQKPMFTIGITMMCHVSKLTSPLLPLSPLQRVLVCNGPHFQAHQPAPPSSSPPASNNSFLFLSRATFPCSP